MRSRTSSSASQTVSPQSYFAFLAPVNWPAVLVLGARLSGRVAAGPDRGPSRAGRATEVLIGAAGMALAVKLGIDAYG